jgi:hypothetical protein
MNSSSTSVVSNLRALADEIRRWQKSKQVVATIAIQQWNRQNILWSISCRNPSREIQTLNLLESSEKKLSWALLNLQSPPKETRRSIAYHCNVEIQADGLRIRVTQRILAPLALSKLFAKCDFYGKTPHRREYFKVCNLLKIQTPCRTFRMLINRIPSPISQNLKPVNVAQVTGKFSIRTQPQ